MVEMGLRGHSSGPFQCTSCSRSLWIHVPATDTGPRAVAFLMVSRVAMEVGRGELSGVLCDADVNFLFIGVGVSGFCPKVDVPSSRARGQEFSGGAIGSETSMLFQRRGLVVQ